MADPYLCFIVVTWKTISTLPNRSLPFDITQKRQEEWNKVLNWALGYALRGDRYPLLLALKSSRSRCKIPLLSQPLRLNFAPLCPQLAAHILIASGRPAECVKMKPRKGRIEEREMKVSPSFLPRSCDTDNNDITCERGFRLGRGANRGRATCMFMTLTSLAYSEWKFTMYSAVKSA